LTVLADSDAGSHGAPPPSTGNVERQINIIFQSVIKNFSQSMSALSDCAGQRRRPRGKSGPEEVGKSPRDRPIFRKFSGFR
jgi:hypothetical protein